jgi:hypothetical protein
MPITWNDSVQGRTLYARFDNAGNTAINFTEGTSLKLGRYSIADSAIVSAGVSAGDYSVRIFEGTAAGQASGDTYVGSIDFAWSGTAEITLRSAYTEIVGASGQIGTLTNDVAAVASTQSTHSTQLTAIVGYTDTVEASLTLVKNYTDTLEASMTTALADLVLIKGYTDSLEATLAGFSGGLSGAGADQVTLTFTETGSGNPIADADVWISTDAAGNNVVAGTRQTNGAGEVMFMLDDGVSYYRWLQKDGIESIDGELFVAVAD